jgi:hypothetical protein
MSETEQTGAATVADAVNANMVSASATLDEHARLVAAVQASRAKREAEAAKQGTPEDASAAPAAAESKPASETGAAAENEAADETAGEGDGGSLSEDAEGAARAAERVAAKDGKDGKVATDDKDKVKDKRPPSSLGAFLRGKAEQQAHRDQSADRAQRMLDQAEERARRIVQDAEDRARNTINDALSEFRRSPTQAAQRYGIDTTGLLREQAEETDPLRRLEEGFRSELAKRDEELKKLRGEVDSTKRERDEERRYVATLRQTEAERKFVTEAQEYKFAAKLWGKNNGTELLARAHKTLTDARAKVEREQGKEAATNFVVSNADLLHYLDEEARGYLREQRQTLSELLQEVGEEAESDTEAPAKPEAKKPEAKPASNANGRAPAGQGQGPRTLSASRAGERRAPPKPAPHKELTEFEFKQQAEALLKKRAQDRA